MYDEVCFFLNREKTEKYETLMKEKTEEIEKLQKEICSLKQELSSLKVEHDSLKSTYQQETNCLKNTITSLTCTKSSIEAQLDANKVHDSNIIKLYRYFYHCKFACIVTFIYFSIK